MVPPPSGVLAGAAASAAALADVVAAFAAATPLPAATAIATARAARNVADLYAPRVRGARDVAALAHALTAALQAAARAAEPADAAPALYAAAARASACIPATRSPALIRQYGLAAALATAVEVAALGEAFLAEARTGFSDQRGASEARGRIDQAYEAAAERVGQRLGQVVLGVLSTVARECTRHLVEQAVTLQPIVRVDLQRSVPSTALAFALYGDPARAPELVSRNRCGTPLFMPTTLEAVAPKA
ncbi:hypothetical protein [Methylobacterium sp. CCH5-D2]|uniref:hypothetical protein n=1 Tax=Methylobacterium sp. CCH5-D2 TaxID=1768765 RepID=UPI00082A654A|nr:hypothetical protein [Methylobacterium sp. CCH5-D2]